MVTNGPMKKMLDGQKIASDMEVQWAVRQWLAQQPTSFFFASRIHKLVERRDKCLNILGGYVEQVGVLIKRLTVGSQKQHHTIAQGL